METYIIKIDVNDITYKSKLTLDVLIEKCRQKMSRVNSPKQLTFISFRKLWAHLIR